MKNRLLAFCSALVLVLGGLAAAPIAPAPIAATIAPTTQAAVGSYACGDEPSGFNPTLYYDFLYRQSTSSFNYSKIQTDFIYGDLKVCDQTAPGNGWGYTQFWLSAQDKAGGKIFQVGYQMCGNPNGCAFANGTIGYLSSAFVYSGTDTTTTGNIYYWTGGPSEVFGHQYRMTITMDNSGATNYWDVCIRDLSVTGSSSYCKSVVKTWGMDYFWIGCEAHNTTDYCGTDSDSSIQLQTNDMKYIKTSEPSTYYTMNGSGNTCVFYEAAGGIANPPLSARCLYNTDHSTVTFQTVDP